MFYRPCYVANLILFIVFAILLASFTTIARGQVASAAIRGQVSDQQGAVVTDAQVVIINDDTGLSRVVRTGDYGTYEANGLPPGYYTIRSKATGFRDEIAHLTLTADFESVADFKLVIGVATDTVEVSGSEPIVNTVSSTVSGLADQSTIQSLPLNGRDFTQLSSLFPGVTEFLYNGPSFSRGLGLHLNVNGARGESTLLLLDGADMSTADRVAPGNAAGVVLGVDTVQEFRILANNADAVYGGAAGAIVSVVTRSGSNTIHGTAFEFLRNSGLDARNYFDPSTGPPPFKRNQFGFSFSGPIAKNKTFIFGAGEWLIQRLTTTQVSRTLDNDARNGVLPDPSSPGVMTVPVSAATARLLSLYPLANGPSYGDGTAQFTFPFASRTNDGFGQLRIDHSFSSRNKAFGRYTYDSADTNLPQSFPGYDVLTKSKYQYLTLNDEVIVSPTLLNTTRFSFSRTDIRRNPRSDLDPTLDFVSGQGLGDITVPGLSLMGPDISTKDKVIQNLFQLNDDVSYTRGRATMHAGALVKRYQTNADTAFYPWGSYEFPSLASFLTGNPFLFVGMVPSGITPRYWRTTSVGLYLQTDLPVRHNLLLNLGLRYEPNTTPLEKNGLQGALPSPLTDVALELGRAEFNNPSLKNLAPRAGFAWDIFGEGKTVVRGGVGAFYDIVFFDVLRAAATLPPIMSIAGILNPLFPSPFVGFNPSQAGLQNLYQPTHNMNNPENLQYNLVVEHQLLRQLAFSAGYVGMRGYNLLRDGNVNEPSPQVLPDGRLFVAKGTPRPNPAFSTIDMKTTDGDSWYNALQLHLTGSVGKHLQTGAAYSFARNIDDGSASTYNAFLSNFDAFRFPGGERLDRGLSALQIKHDLSVNYIWDLPFGSGLTGVPAGFGKGWQLSGIVSYASGPPFDVVIQTDWANMLSSYVPCRRPDLKPGVDISNIILGGPNHYFDPSAFVLPPNGVLGDFGRNVLTGPARTGFDVGLGKTFALPWLGDQGALKFRGEVFNLFNHANFGMPNPVVFAGQAAGEAPLQSAGQITNTVTPSRQIQFGLKLQF